MMDLYVLTKNDFTQGPSVGRITKRATTGARFGRGMTRRQGSAIGRPRNEPRKQVTSEELDRELDAYMRVIGIHFIKGLTGTGLANGTWKNLLLAVKFGIVGEGRLQIASIAYRPQHRLMM
ncbi:unnamed protein product [Gongylonema pulchrum]|uniref:FoP_duplication domain-containing protein n=1 Tax=Gongylonema pulchrum TaxID=637853 RepID=A0A183CVT9_9BILA|nr:unnamed protein product [Gongylonema pulchrum]